MKTEDKAKIDKIICDWSMFNQCPISEQQLNALVDMLINKIEEIIDENSR